MDGPGEVNGRLVRALRLQLERRQALLDAGGHHIGWKVGLGESERIGGHDVAVGYLTSATVVPAGSRCQLIDGGDLHANVEIAVELGGHLLAGTGPAEAGKAIAAMAVAVEIVDLAAGRDAVAVVAGNIFHRAVAFGGFMPAADGVSGVARLSVNGQECRSNPVPRTIAERVAAAGRLLAAMGHPLRAGDRIITGTIAQAPIRAGDTITAQIYGLGTVSLLVLVPRASAHSDVTAASAVQEGRAVKEYHCGLR